MPALTGPRQRSRPAPRPSAPRAAPISRFQQASTALGGFTFDAGAPAYTFQLVTALHRVLRCPESHLDRRRRGQQRRQRTDISVYIGSTLTFQNAEHGRELQHRDAFGDARFQKHQYGRQRDHHHAGHASPRLHHVSTTRVTAGNASFTLRKHSARRSRRN